LVQLTPEQANIQPLVAGQRFEFRPPDALNVTGKKSLPRTCGYG